MGGSLPERIRQRLYSKPWGQPDEEEEERYVFVCETCHTKTNGEGGEPEPKRPRRDGSGVADLEATAIHPGLSNEQPKE